MQGITYATGTAATMRQRLAALDTATMLWWIFRIGCAMCFIGHGAFGILGKQEWIPFFAAAGIGPEAARGLMPVIGAVDIAAGISVLVAPRRAVVLYMAIWAVWTAALRPLTGDSPFEMLERAGNYGLPLAFLLFLGPVRSTREMLAVATIPRFAEQRVSQVELVLRWTTALLLIGHGALAAINQKAMLGTHMEAIGLPASAAITAGWIEIVLAMLVLAHPRPALLIGIVFWKLATELLFPISGAPIWEFVERGGSYGAPLALALLIGHRSAARPGTRHVAAGTRAARAGGIASLMALASLSPSLVEAQDSVSTAHHLAGEELVTALRRGGYILLFRHTETDRQARDRGRAREEQRNLTPDGERHAREIGAAIRELAIPVGEIRASYMYRTMETAQLAFGRVEPDSTLRGGNTVASLRAHLAVPVPPGSNRVLLSHNGAMSQALKGHGAPRMAEGDIIIVEPLGGEGFRVIAKVAREEWPSLLFSLRDATPSGSPSAGPPAPRVAPEARSRTGRSQPAPQPDWRR